MAETAKLLEELGLEQVPRVLLFNKMDRLPEHEREIFERLEEAVPCTAIDKAQTQRLLEVLEQRLGRDDRAHVLGAAEPSELR
jgi:GTP-binding protein HflX